MTILTRVQPSKAQRADVAFAMPIVRRIGGMDVGHCIAIKEREVIAVEAEEGTAAMIARARDLCRHGKWTLVLFASAAGQSPTINAALVEQMKAAGARCLAIDASLDAREDVLREAIDVADASKVAIIRFDAT